MDHQLRINITNRSVLVEWCEPGSDLVEMYRIDVPQLDGSSVEITADLSDKGCEEMDVSIVSPVVPVAILPKRGKSLLLG